MGVKHGDVCMKACTVWWLLLLDCCGLLKVELIAIDVLEVVFPVGYLKQLVIFFIHYLINLLIE